jgi:hypothetical protein
MLNYMFGVTIGCEKNTAHQIYIVYVCRIWRSEFAVYNERRILVLLEVEPSKIAN